VAVLQVVAGLSPPYYTLPSHPGGRGRDDLPTRTVRDPEPQPIARKAGGELEKDGGELGKAGGELEKAGGELEGLINH
jgi:hypothetical protein